MFDKKEYMKQYYAKNETKKHEHFEQHNINSTSNTDTIKQTLEKHYDSLGSGVYIACFNKRILYIGQSDQLMRCFDDHKSSYKISTYIHNIHLQNFIKQHNDEIEFVILENCSKDKLRQREQYYINLLKPEFNQI